MCFLLPGWGWHETEEERGIGTGPVEDEGAEPVLRATGGSEEPLSISDTGVRTGICCWEEAMALKRRNVMTDSDFFCYENYSCQRSSGRFSLDEGTNFQDVEKGDHKDQTLLLS